MTPDRSPLIPDLGSKDERVPLKKDDGVTKGDRGWLES